MLWSQDAFEEEFVRYGVDMTWHGHHHTYQRSCPLYKGRCVPPNPGANPSSSAAFKAAALCIALDSMSVLHCANSSTPDM